LTLTSFEDPTGKRFGDGKTKINNAGIEIQMRVLENKIDDLEAKLKQADEADIGNLPDQTLCVIALDPGHPNHVAEATRRGLTEDTCRKRFR
jgi:hypothetical protein